MACSYAYWTGDREEVAGMKRALLKSHNLIGDGLYVGPVAEKWFRTEGYKYDEIHLYTLKNHATSLYEGMGVPWKLR